VKEALAAAARSASGSGTLDGQDVGTRGGRASGLRRPGRREGPHRRRAHRRPALAGARLSATLAVAAVGHEALRGQPPEQAEDLLHARLHALGGLASHEHHAERIFLAALAAAVRAAPAE
jgi:hypothetical protein